MKLKKLIRNIGSIEVKGPREVEITGISSNSKLVAPGNLFIAKRGLTTDGSNFIPEAVTAGAAAVVTDVFDPSLQGVAQIICHDVLGVEGAIASAYNGRPSEKMAMIGITGTNGKTTTAYLVKHLLGALYAPCGLIGTIEYIIGGQRYKATHTTPDVVAAQKILGRMRTAGMGACVMEATSHGLDQGRLNDIHFDVAIFTNLSLDHLDYHLSMKSYLSAKKRLFSLLDRAVKKKIPKAAILNADDPYCSDIAEGVRGKVLTYGIDNKADIRARDILFMPGKTLFKLESAGGAIRFSLPLTGRFNVYNALAAIAVACCFNIPMSRVAKILKNFPPVEGRLEPVVNDLNLKIYVDFAHTPDALENVLRCLKEVCDGRLITVFGCGGDRDRRKRPLMAEIVEKYSDFALVTDDNPRKEDSRNIIRDIIRGFKNANFFMVEPDRRGAIERAVDIANGEDIILIAGRGHERYQIFAHYTVEFNDAEVIKEICKERCRC